MKEKVLDNKKNGMGMMVLFILLYAVAAAHQEITIQTNILRPALLDHGIHIGQQAVHTVGEAKGIGLFPELGGLIAQGRNKGIVLHVGGAEGISFWL